MDTGLRLEDRMDGSTNYSIWKERIVLVLEENDISEFADQTHSPPTDGTLLIAWKKDVKARRIILDRVKDHIVPHVSEKKTATEM